MEKHVRELRDYLKDYGASNIRVEPGTKHQKLCFEYGGIDRSYIVAHRPSTDHHAMENTKATLRRMLGPPVPPEEKQPRKLEEMMEDLNRTTAAVTYIGTPPVTKPSKTWPVLMCAYTHKKTTTQLYFHFAKGVEQMFPRGVRIERLDDEHWKLTPGGRSRFHQDGATTRSTVSCLDRLTKPFGSTEAEAVEADGAILVYLSKDNRTKVIPSNGSKPWPTQQLVTPPVPANHLAALTTKPPAPAPAPVPASLENQMRDIIRQIQGIEATCPYHLVRLEGGRIQWRAPIIE